MTVHCSNHCSACGQHFHSVIAFDAHRQGPWDDRVCLDPEVEQPAAASQRLVPLTRDGKCRIRPRAPVDHATIWVVERDLNRVRAHHRPIRARVTCGAGDSRPFERP